MTIASQIAKHFKDVHFGGNWTSVNYRDVLAEVSWQQAGTKVQSFNTILTLVNHVKYYMNVVERVLLGEPLIGKDAESFVHSSVNNTEEWDVLRNEFWAKAETVAALIAQLPDSKLTEPFFDEKYGTYYRNLQGMVEHHHYHLGQIVIIKKLLNT
jgi:uncharacterized damage-inducible protein DinB